MSTYLDTNVVVWLAQGNLAQISPRARKLLETTDLLISPMVLVELEYLYEVHRIKLPSRDIHAKLQHEISLRVCDLPFSTVASFVIDEKWTRDPFDRTVVAQARANGLSALISADAEIQEHYLRTVW